MKFFAVEARWFSDWFLGLHIFYIWRSGFNTCPCHCVVSLKKKLYCMLSLSPPAPSLPPSLVNSVILLAKYPAMDSIPTTPGRLGQLLAYGFSLLVVILCFVILSFESESEILQSDQSNARAWAAIFFNTVLCCTMWSWRSCVNEMLKCDH